MANDLTRKIMANIAAKTIAPQISTGSYGNLSADEEVSLSGVIHGGHKAGVSAPRRSSASGGTVTLAALAQQRRHG